MNYLDYEAALEVVKEFYTSAWENLKWLVSIAFGVVFIIPTITSIIQIIASNRLDKKIEKNIKENKKNTLKLKHDVVDATGRLHFLQGDFLSLVYSYAPDNEKSKDLYKRSFTDSIVSYFKALKQFIDVQNDSIIDNIMKLLLETHTNSSERCFLNSREYRYMFNIVMDEFEKNNKGGKYIKHMSTLKKFYDYNKSNDEKTKQIKESSNDKVE